MTNQDFQTENSDQATSFKKRLEINQSKTKKFDIDRRSIKRKDNRNTSLQSSLRQKVNRKLFLWFCEYFEAYTY